VDGPPYARIAAELRGQIERGELQPGQRVPSTREITARWGVAMATATKVLAMLRQDGLVRPVPGVGTVVSETAPAPVRHPVPARSPAPDGAPGAPSAPDRRPGPGADRPATRIPMAPDRIVAAAIRVADAEGLAALSMRRVAAEIGAAPMSLYRHVADKDDLVVQMMNTVFAQTRLPEPPPDGWRARLELAARTLWAMFRAHPWLASALSLTRPQVMPDALPYTEWLLTALDGHGLELSTTFTTYLMLINYVRGTAVNLEAEAEAEAATGLNSEEWLQTQEAQFWSSLPPDGYPLFQQLISEEYDFSLDEIFEFGLQRLLDGLAALITE
jgi:AcrR family transcriptional regulator